MTSKVTSLLAKPFEVTMMRAEPITSKVSHSRKRHMPFDQVHCSAGAMNSASYAAQSWIRFLKPNTVFSPSKAKPDMVVQRLTKEK